MTDNTGKHGDPWDEGEDDDEQTQVAVNPLFRPVSSFGVPRSRPGVGQAVGDPPPYDSLLESGDLDAVDELDVMDLLPEPLAADPGLDLPELPPPPNLHGLARVLEELDSGAAIRDSAEELRPSDFEAVAVLTRRTLASGRLTPPSELPKPIPVANVPSILLGPGASTRNEVTERFSLMPSTHPLANSIAPTAWSAYPQALQKRRFPVWPLGAAALLLVGLGVAVGVYGVRVPTAGAPAERRAAVASAPPPKARPPIAVVEPAPAVAVVEPAVVAPGAEPVVAEPPAATAAGAMVEPAVVERAPAVIGPVASPRQADGLSPKGDGEPDVAVTAVIAEEEPARESVMERRRRRALRAARAAAERQQAEAAPSPSSTPTERLRAVSSSARPTLAAEPEQAPAGRSPPIAASASLPEQPSREQVVAAMDRVLPELGKCVGNKHGAASVTITVRSNGTVSYALVGGSFAGTPEGSCIARVLRQAQFPAFSAQSMRLTYPFQL